MARIFQSGIVSAIRWHGAFEETRRTTPSPTTGAAFYAEAHRDWLLELRRKENDLTLDQVAARLLKAHGVKADKSMLSLLRC